MKQPICQCGLAVIDMCDDAKVANVVQGHNAA
jgi:hypothetical protein